MLFDSKKIIKNKKKEIIDIYKFIPRKRYGFFFNLIYVFYDFKDLIQALICCYYYTEFDCKKPKTKKERKKKKDNQYYNNGIKKPQVLLIYFTY